MTDKLKTVNENPKRSPRKLRYFVALPTKMVEEYLTAYEEYNALCENISCIEWFDKIAKEGGLQIKDVLIGMMEGENNLKRYERIAMAMINLSKRREQPSDLKKGTFTRVPEAIQGLKEYLGQAIEPVLSKHQNRNDSLFKSRLDGVAAYGPAVVLSEKKDFYQSWNREKKGQKLPISFQSVRSDPEGTLERISNTIGFSSDAERQKFERTLPTISENGKKIRAGFSKREELIGLLEQFNYNPHIVATALNIGLIEEFIPARENEKHTPDSILQDITLYMQLGIIPASGENLKKAAEGQPAKCMETSLFAQIKGRMDKLMIFDMEYQHQRLKGTINYGKKEETILFHNEKRSLVETDIVLGDMNDIIGRTAYFAEYFGTDSDTDELECESDTADGSEKEKITEEKKARIRATEAENEIKNGIHRAAYRALQRGITILRVSHQELSKEHSELLAMSKGELQRTGKELESRPDIKIGNRDIRMGNPAATRNLLEMPDDENDEFKEIRNAFKGKYGDKGKLFYLNLKEITKKTPAYAAVIPLAYSINFPENAPTPEAEDAYKNNAQVFCHVLKNHSKAKTMEKLQNVISANQNNKQYALRTDEGRRMDLSHPQKQQMIANAFVRTILTVESQETVPMNKLITWVEPSDLETAQQKYLPRAQP